MVTLISALLAVGSLLPALARASVFDTILAPLTKTTSDSAATNTPNLQTMPLVQAAYNLNPAPATGGGDVTIIDNSALVSEEGPSGTLADIVKPKNGTISSYVVQPGDTLASIARMFNVPVNTILWANDLTRSSRIQPGDTLVILPIPGAMYTIKSGDTLESIAKRFGSDPTDIGSYNGVDDSSLAVGQQIIIPNAEASSASGSSGSGGETPSGSVCHGRLIPFAGNPLEPAHNIGPAGTCAQIAYYISPLTHYHQTQGIHGYNAVDLAAPIGTQIMAAAAGTIIVARDGGWNGGYGSYVVIQHANGSQTLYAHMSEVNAYDGEHVVQGQIIGHVGTSGDSTGAHVHFEIRNGIRNPF